MTDLTVRTREAPPTRAPIKTIPQEAVSALRAKVRGTVALPGEDGYEAARTIWNGMINRRPALVVRCLGAADVINAVNFARDENLRRVLARGSAAEIRVDDEHRPLGVADIAERVLFPVRLAVVFEEMLFEAVKRHDLEKPRRHDAVRVDIVAAQRDASP